MKTVKTYFCNIDNFGDALNVPIFKRFGIQTEHTSIDKATIIGIGSILDDLLYKKRQYFTYKYNQIFKKRTSPIFIYSSGFGFDLYTHERKKKYLFPRKLSRNVIPIALRGAHTKQQLKKITDSNISVPLGDGGLLCSEIKDFSKISKKYSLGIVAHYADANNPIFKKVRDDLKGSVIINTVYNNPVDFIEKLAECECVISTAMHPLIACDSLGIPNKWIRISETTTSVYKFNDYYSVFRIRQDPIKLLELNNFNSLIDLVKYDYKIETTKVESIKNSLIKAFKENMVNI